MSKYTTNWNRVLLVGGITLLLLNTGITIYCAVMTYHIGKRAILIPEVDSISPSLRYKNNITPLLWEHDIMEPTYNGVIFTDPLLPDEVSN